jgi:hypothetical protein
MFDLHLCLSSSVNVMPILHTQPLGLYNKILVGNPFVLCYVLSLSRNPFLAYPIYPPEWSTQGAAMPTLRTMMLRTTTLPTRHPH